MNFDTAMRHTHMRLSNEGLKKVSQICDIKRSHSGQTSKVYF